MFLSPMACTPPELVFPVRKDVARPREEMMAQWVPALADSAFVNWHRAPTAIAVADTHCLVLHVTLRLFVMTSHC